MGRPTAARDGALAALACAAALAAGCNDAAARRRAPRRGGAVDAAGARASRGDGPGTSGAPAATDATPVCLPAGAPWRSSAGPPRAVGPFCIDPTLVTRAAFARFVAATRYVTSAERQGFGMESVEGMLDWEWRRAAGASWRRPFSVEDADTRAFLRDDAPVVMVSWHDAVAYCAWRGGRLPTEAEWEYAMGAGARGTRYPWGARADDDAGVPRLNYWQGASHARNDRRDGHVYVSPVRAFAPNAWGLFDPVGNVWQWTADVYQRLRDAPPEPTNVRGEDAGAGGEPERVLRGGSWWCAACTCEGYGLQYRGHAHPRAAFSNNGFRCVYDRAAAAR